MKTETRKRVLILGGGFGGLYTALELEKRLACRRDLEVTLVNRENFFLFTPLLHEVAASDLDFTHIVNPVRKLLRRTKFFQGTIERVDLETRRVTVSHGLEHLHELEYDYLVVALGAVTNFYNLPALHFAHDGGEMETTSYWYRSFEYREERARGFDFTEDLFNPFVLRFDLGGRKQLSVIVSTERREARRASLERRRTPARGRRRHLQLRRAAGHHR